MAGMRREVLMAGFGWIGAGIVSIAAWSVVSRRAVECVMNCPKNPNGMLYLGVFVLLVGIAVLSAGKRISAIIEVKLARMEEEKRKASPKNFEHENG